MVVAHKYATLLAERSTDSEAGGKTTSSAVVTFGSIPLTAPPSYVTDATVAAASSSVSLEILSLGDHFKSTL